MSVFIKIVHFSTEFQTVVNNDTYFYGCRLAVRYAAAVIRKFASSIAPHITTLVVHGKQVMA